MGSAANWSTPSTTMPRSLAVATGKTGVPAVGERRRLLDHRRAHGRRSGRCERGTLAAPLIARGKPFSARGSLTPCERLRVGFGPQLGVNREGPRAATGPAVVHPKITARSAIQVH